MSYFISVKNIAHLHSSPEGGGADAITRSALLKLLLHEVEKSCPTSRQLDKIEHQIAELRQLIYRQVELFEKGKLTSREAGASSKSACDIERPYGDLPNASSKISALAE